MTVPVVLDARVHRLGGGRVLLGGDPGRLVRLRRPDPLDALAVGGALADVLLDGGLAHPRPAPRPARDVVVVVPVRDRAQELARCLAALGPSHPVLVVDDASRDAAEVARVCAAHGARVLCLGENVGPAGARNAGLAATTEPLVAFLDSDCVPPPGWLDALRGHFDDPRTGAVAPRVRALPAPGLLGRYGRARGPLDLGREEARVRPGGRVPYVPTAALVVRRAALPDGGFDAQLRFGEDVDLVWRLHDAGWRVRYDPRTEVAHEEPAGWSAWLRRRHAYGTSAAPLAARHPGRLAPLVLPPWPASALLLLVAGHPAAAAVVAAVPAVRLHARLRQADLPHRACATTALRVTGQALTSTARGLGGGGSVVTAPVLLGLLARRGWRLRAVALLLVPPLLEHLDRRPAVDPVRWSVLRVVDDLAYAGGVWRGAWSARSPAALRPRRTRPT